MTFAPLAHSSRSGMVRRPLPRAHIPAGTARECDVTHAGRPGMAEMIAAPAGEPDIKKKLLTGYDSMGKTFKV